MSSDHDSDAIIHTVMKESQQQKKISPTKKKNAATRMHRLKHQTSMPDPFAHSESDWSFRDTWNESKKLWHKDDHEILYLVLTSSSL